MTADEAHDVAHTGLLHDLGRVGASNMVWNKPSRLEVDEWEQVRLHSYYTERILSHAGSLATLTGLAVGLHERGTGDGYHRRRAAPAIDVASSVLAAADMYVALTSARCHRPAFDCRGAVDELKNAIRRGRLDATATEVVIDTSPDRRPAPPVSSAPAADRRCSPAARTG